MKIKTKALFILLLLVLNTPGTSFSEPTLTQKVFIGYKLTQDWDLLGAENFPNRF